METGTTILQVLLALGATLALVLFAAWAVRGLSGGNLRSGGVIRVLGGTPLGSRERLLLVEVHGRQMLLGVTQHQVGALHVFDPDTPLPDSQGPDFKQALASITGRKSS